MLCDFFDWLLSLLKKIIIIGVIIILVMIAFGTIFYVKETHKHFLVSEQIAKCQELVMAKYIYGDAVVVKKFGEKVIETITVTVRAGLSDINKIWFLVSSDGDRVFVMIPQCEILSSGITDRENVLDDRLNVVSNITKDEVDAAVAKKQSEIIEQTIKDGIFEDAAKRSRVVIEQIMKAIDFKEVIIRCDGVDKDDAESVAWYADAVERGALQGQQLNTTEYRLGMCYFYGNGVNRNESKAEEWFKKAAEDGNSDAENMLKNFF